MRLPDVVASFDGITPHVYTVFSHLLISYLATKDVKLTCVLCYVALLCLRLRLSSALHLLHLCRLPLFGYYPPNILTARCLLAAYPGIQQMVLFFPPYISLHSLPPFAMSCPFC
jgi:hypothetical protein